MMSSSITFCRSLGVKFIYTHGTTQVVCPTALKYTDDALADISNEFVFSILVGFQLNWVYFHCHLGTLLKSILIYLKFPVQKRLSIYTNKHHKIIVFVAFFLANLANDIQQHCLAQKLS